MSTRRRTAGLLFASMFLIFLACNESPTEPDSEVAFQTVLKATLPGTVPDLQGRETVRDQTAWQEVWAELHREAPTPPPAIDFSREMVIVVAGAGCGGDTTISSIVRDGGRLVVSARTVACGNTLCARADFSVHAVLIPRSGSPASLNVSRESKLC